MHPLQSISFPQELVLQTPLLVNPTLYFHSTAISSRFRSFISLLRKLITLQILSDLRSNVTFLVWTSIWLFHVIYQLKYFVCLPPLYLECLNKQNNCFSKVMELTNHMKCLFRETLLRNENKSLFFLLHTHTTYIHTHICIHTYIYTMF